MNRLCVCAVVCALLLLGVRWSEVRAEVAVDVSKYSPDCRVAVARDGERLTLAWPIARGEGGHLALNLSGTAPLVAELGSVQHAAAQIGLR